MKKTIILLMMSLGLISSFAQKANLDREYFKVNYVQLPSNPILDDANRTYTTNNGAVTIAGFSKVSANGSIEIDYRYEGSTIENVSVETIKREKKDKNGKVISTTYSYRSHANFVSRASLNVYNAITGKSYNRNYSKSTSHIGKSYKSRYQAQRDF